MTADLREAIARCRYFETFDISEDFDGDTCGSLADHFNDLAYELAAKHGVDVSDAYRDVDRMISDAAEDARRRKRSMDEMAAYRLACMQLSR